MMFPGSLAQIVKGQPHLDICGPFSLSSSPWKFFVLSHRVGGTTLIAEGREQVNSLPRVTQHYGGGRGLAGRSWDRCEPWALLLFIKCQHLSSPWGLMEPGNH